MATSWLLSERSSLRNASRIPLLDIVTCSLEGDPPPHRAGRHSASTRAHRPKHQRGSQEVLRDRSRRSLTRPVVAPTWCVKSGSRRGSPTSPPASPPAPGAGAGRTTTAWRGCGRDRSPAAPGPLATAAAVTPDGATSSGVRSGTVVVSNAPGSWGDDDYVLDVAPVHSILPSAALRRRPSVLNSPRRWRSPSGMAMTVITAAADASMVDVMLIGRCLPQSPTGPPC